VEMPSAPCEVFSFITTMTVHATFLGPPIVGLATLRACWSEGSSTRHRRTSRALVATALCLPWLFGVVIGVVARNDGKSGSYRGLLCYNTDWDSFSTSGITITMFVLSTAATMLSYVIVACKVRSRLRSAGSKVADKRFADVLKRGRALVLICFLSWACFMIVVVLNSAYQPVPLTIEMLASMIIGLQPIADTFVLLQTPSVRTAMVTRIFSKYFKRPTLAQSGFMASGSKSALGSARDVLSIRPAINATAASCEVVEVSLPSAMSSCEVHAPQPPECS